MAKLVELLHLRAGDIHREAEQVDVIGDQAAMPLGIKGGKTAVGIGDEQTITADPVAGAAVGDGDLGESIGAVAFERVFVDGESAELVGLNHQGIAFGAAIVEVGFLTRGAEITTESFHAVGAEDGDQVVGVAKEDVSADIVVVADQAGLATEAALAGAVDIGGKDAWSAVGVKLKIVVLAIEIGFNNDVIHPGGIDGCIGVDSRDFVASGRTAFVGLVGAVGEEQALSACVGAVASSIGLRIEGAQAEFCFQGKAIAAVEVTACVLTVEVVDEGVEGVIAGFASEVGLHFR